jgi:anti-anti-sigma factor
MSVRGMTGGSVSRARRGELSPVSDRFSLQSVVRGDAVNVVVTGALDVAAAFKLEPEIERLMAAPGVRALTVDLAAVDFIDSSGLGTLLSLRERAERLAVAFAVARVSEAVRRILELTGTRSLLGA